jgi:hypothetical protein
LFLRDFDNAPGAAQCRISINPNTTSSPLWVFENTGAGAWWVDNVVREITTNEPQTTAVFFDTTDANACGFSFTSVGCANISDAFRTRRTFAKAGDRALPARGTPIE